MASSNEKERYPTTLEFYLSSLDSAYFFILGLINIPYLFIILFDPNELGRVLFDITSSDPRRVFILVLLFFLFGAGQQVKAIIKNSVSERLLAWRTLFLNVGFGVIGLLSLLVTRIPFDFIPNIPLRLSLVFYIALLGATVGVTAIFELRDLAYFKLEGTVRKIFPYIDPPKIYRQPYKARNRYFWIERILLTALPAVGILFAFLTPEPASYGFFFIPTIVFIFLSITDTSR